MSEENKLPASKELGFLYKKTNFKPYIISKIGLVPEYVEVINSYKGDIDDKVIYLLLKEVCLNNIDNDKGNRLMKDIMNKVSKEVTGDTSSWRK